MPPFFILYYSHHIKFSSKKLKLVKHICQQKNVICYGAYMVKVTVWVSVSKLTKKKKVSTKMVLCNSHAYSLSLCA